MKWNERKYPHSDNAIKTNNFVEDGDTISGGHDSRGDVDGDDDDGDAMQTYILIY